MYTYDISYLLIPGPPVSPPPPLIAPPPATFM